MAPDTRHTVLALCDYFLPGFRAGGVLRTVANMLALLGSEFRFRIVTRARPHENGTLSGHRALHLVTPQRLGSPLSFGSPAPSMGHPSPAQRYASRHPLSEQRPLPPLRHHARRTPPAEPDSATALRRRSQWRARRRLAADPGHQEGDLPGVGAPAGSLCRRLLARLGPTRSRRHPTRVWKPPADHDRGEPTDADVAGRGQRTRAQTGQSTRSHLSGPLGSRQESDSRPASPMQRTG